jgi:hypothetical protein
MTFRPLLEQVRSLASGDRALRSVQSIARFHRVQASPGYDAAARWLAAELRAIGLEPEIEQVPGDGTTRFWGELMPEGWECHGARATLIENGARRVLCDYDACHLSLVLRSTPARGSFRIVVLEDGTEDAHYNGVDVRGAVVLTRGAAYRVHTLAVIERGAAGILCDGRRLFPPVRAANDDPDQVAYTSFWWNGDEPRGWGFVVSPRAGAELRAQLAAGHSLTLDVEIASRRFATSIPIVTAHLPGEVDRDVLVISHLCHPEPSANDNASGVAASLETVRVLAALRHTGAWRPHAGVRFVWMPELTGTCAWLARDPGRARRLIAGINLDMVGEDQEACGSTLLIEHPPCFAASFAEELLARIRAEAVDWVTDYSGPGHVSLTRMAEVPYSGGSDHAVLIDPAVGVPTPMLIQWPDRYYHSSHDTPDRTDPRSLALAVRCAATYAGFLAALDDDDRAWMVEVVARGARTRVLRALDAPDPAWAVARAVCAGQCALASLGRLGERHAQIADACAGFDAFVAREAGHLPAPVPPSPTTATSATSATPVSTGLGDVPRRGISAPLGMLKHLAPGWHDQPRAAREAYRALEIATPGAPTVFELAWYACDGSRTIDQIARLVWLETGISAGDRIAAFFMWAAGCGWSDWTERA